MDTHIPAGVTLSQEKDDALEMSGKTSVNKAWGCHVADKYLIEIWIAQEA